MFQAWPWRFIALHHSGFILSRSSVCRTLRLWNRRSRPGVSKGKHFFLFAEHSWWILQEMEIWSLSINTKMSFKQFISTSTRSWCPGSYVKWLREVPSLAEQQMKTPISVTLLPLDSGKCLYSCSVDIFTTLSEVLAVSEGWVSGLAASMCASRSLVSWFGDWKARAAAAARTEWGPHSSNVSLWGEAACVLISWIHDPLKEDFQPV